MGHHCCNKQKVKRGLWSPEEDEKLIRYVTAYGHGCWSAVPKQAGLQRCGKSCRLRWINYLRPDLKRGSFSLQEERIIIDVHRILGNRWAQIAKHLPGRTDNEVKNFWNSCIKKKLLAQGIDPKTHRALSEQTRKLDRPSPSSNITEGCSLNTNSASHDAAGSHFFNLKLNGGITETASRYLCGDSTLGASGDQNVGLNSTYGIAVNTAWSTEKFPSQSNPLSSLNLQRPQENIPREATPQPDGLRDAGNISSISKGTWQFDSQMQVATKEKRSGGAAANLDMGDHQLQKTFVNESINDYPNSMLLSNRGSDSLTCENKPYFPLNLTELDQRGLDSASYEAVNNPLIGILIDQMSGRRSSSPQMQAEAAFNAESSDCKGEQYSGLHTNNPIPRAMQLPKLCERDLDECCNSVREEGYGIHFPSSYGEHFDLDLFDSSAPIGIYCTGTMNSAPQWES
eukprot:Gb_03994 [translate_table: standard]